MSAVDRTDAYGDVNSGAQPLSAGFCVVIPAFRAAATVGRAVDSALRSGAARVLVIDDGSNDDTAARAVDAGAECVTQQNAGAAAARRAGAQLVTNEFVIFLDADDLLLPEGVAGSLEVLRADPHLAVAAGTVIGIGRDGEERAFPVRYSPVTTKTLLREGYGPWPPCAAVVRTTALRLAEDLSIPVLSPPFAEDYELLIRLSLVGGVHVRPQASCVYALSGGKSVSSALAGIEAKEHIRAHYARHTGVRYEEMTQRQRKMAAQVRRARAHWASGERFRAVRLLIGWALRDPTFALRKLRNRPWQRN